MLQLQQHKTPQHSHAELWLQPVAHMRLSMLAISAFVPQWPTYTNMGVDHRNQFDMIRSMPGGLPAVARLVKQFHTAGVRVLFPYHPWDTSTRRELCGDSGPETVTALNCTPGTPLDDARATAAILLATGADGLNGDTMPKFDRQFYVKGKEIIG